MKMIKLLFGVALLALMAIVTVTHFAQPAKADVPSLVQSTSIKEGGDQTFTHVKIVPQGTNVAFSVYDKTGTNAFRINVTNATPEVVMSNTVYPAVTYTNIVVTNTGGQTHTITIRNGLITLYN
jgi:protein-disulfide isomerase